MAREIKEKFVEETGYTLYEVGSFSFLVDGYDADSVVIHKTDTQNPAFPIFVRESHIDFKGDKKKYPYAFWEALCESAWKQATLQSKA